MKFLVDRCAGRRLAHWLLGQGHDVREATDAKNTRYGWRTKNHQDALGRR